MVPISDNGLDFSTKRLVISESRFPNKTSINSLVKHLRSVRATGKIVITMSQGGVNEIKFEARHAINGDEKVEILFTP